jgi:hypothetical protein
VARTLLGRDYVNAAGRTTGTIPAFDTAVDANGDGYQRAPSTPTQQARMRGSTRVACSPAYGQMRFATNPANAAFRRGRRTTMRMLQQFPGRGLFLDNSGACPVRRMTSSS